MLKHYDAAATSFDWIYMKPGSSLSTLQPSVYLRLVLTLSFSTSLRPCSAGLQADLHKLQQPRHLSQRDEPWERSEGLPEEISPDSEWGGKQEGVGGTPDDFRRLRRREGRGWKDGNLSLHKQRGCYFFEQIQGSRLERRAYEELAGLEKGDGRQKGDWTINFPLPTLSERCSSGSTSGSRCRPSEPSGTHSTFSFWSVQHTTVATAAAQSVVLF